MEFYTPPKEYTDLQSLKEENAQLKVEVASLKASNESLADEVRVEKNKVNNCHLKMAENEDKVTEYDTLKLEYLEMQHELENLRVVMKSTQDKLEEAEKKCETAENWVAIKDSIIEKQTKFTKQLEESKKEVENERSGYQEIVVDLNNKLTHVQADLAKTTELLESTKAAFENQKIEAARLRKDMESIIEFQEISIKEENVVLSHNSQNVDSSSDLKTNATSETIADDMKDVSKGPSDGIPACPSPPKPPSHVIAAVKKAADARTYILKQLDEERAAKAALEKAKKQLEMELKDAKVTIAEGDELYREMVAKMEKQDKMFGVNVLRNLEDEKKSLIYEREHLTSELTGLRATVEELQNRVHVEQSKAASKTTDLINSNKKLVQSQVECSSLKTQLTTARKSLDEAMTEVALCQSARAKLNRLVEGKEDPAIDKAKVSKLEEKVDELQQQLNDRDDLILKVHDEISKKSARIETLVSERNDAIAEVTLLKKDIYSMKKDRDSGGGFAPSSSKRTSLASQLQEEIDRQKDKRYSEYKARKKAEADFDSLHDKFTAISKQHKEAEELIKMLKATTVEKSRIAEAQSQLKELRSDNEAKRCELHDLKSRMELKSTQIEEMTTQLKSKDKKLTDTISQLKGIKSAHSISTNKVNELTGTVSSLTRDLSVCYSDLTTIVTSNRFLSRSFEALNNKIKTRDNQIAILNQKLSEAHLATKNLQEVVKTNGVEYEEYDPFEAAKSSPCPLKPTSHTATNNGDTKVNTEKDCQLVNYNDTSIDNIDLPADEPSSKPAVSLVNSYDDDEMAISPGNAETDILPCDAEGAISLCHSTNIEVVPQATKRSFDTLLQTSESRIDPASIESLKAPISMEDDLSSPKRSRLEECVVSYQNMPTEQTDFSKNISTEPAMLNAEQDTLINQETESIVLTTEKESPLKKNTTVEASVISMEQGNILKESSIEPSIQAKEQENVLESNSVMSKLSTDVVDSIPLSSSLLSDDVNELIETSSETPHLPPVSLTPSGDDKL